MLALNILISEEHIAAIRVSCDFSLPCSFVEGVTLSLSPWLIQVLAHFMEQGWWRVLEPLWSVPFHGELRV